MNAAVHGHGRNQEREADRLGLDYMVKAGYDPREGPIVFEHLLKEYGDRSRVANFFYGSHPNNVERFETLSGLVKTQYAKDVKEKRLMVNTEEFKRVTRAVVDRHRPARLRAVALQHRPRDVREGRPLVAGRSGAALLPRQARARDGARRRRGRSAQALCRRAQGRCEVRARVSRSSAWRSIAKAIARPRSRNLERYLELDPEAEDKKTIEATIQELKRSAR